jgi:hypothetical protein
MMLADVLVRKMPIELAYQAREALRMVTVGKMGEESTKT